MPEPLISLSGVGLKYRRRKGFFRHDYYQALRSVTFDVHKGETVAILGRNGSGKSTLLRLVAGIFVPDSGRIITNNATITLLALSAGFDQELSGRDNIIISAMLLGLSKQEAMASIEQIIDYSELGGFIGQPVKTYSTGMRLRLAFSIAVMIRPDVLLIDEVLGAGDAHFRKKAKATILDKLHSHQTVILVTHHTSQIKELCDRAIWLEGGTVKMQGVAGEVVDCYEEFLEDSRGVGSAD